MIKIAASKKLDFPPKEMKASEEGQQIDKEVLSKILEELKVITIRTLNIYFLFNF